MLNGANAALVETEAGWELIQFAQADLVDVEEWKLTRLLRGQQGSEPANAAGAAVGARILFVTGAEQRLDVAGWERGLELTWRAWRRRPEKPEAWSGQVLHLGVAQRMWSPAHLRVERSAGDLNIQWIRRARKDGDPWSAGEPPQETPERYAVKASGPVGVVREWDVAETLCVYSASEQAEDFPAGGEVVIEAAQLGPDGEPGAWTALSMEISA